jgi:uncharacterized cupin superfamily protein
VSAEDAAWFVTNVRDATWMTSRFGAAALFEPPAARFPQLGVNIRVLEPGQPSAMYHRESGQEDFLVLSGACLLIVEGEERRLGPWDFVHAPPGTAHVFVGAGEGPCVLLMVGARPEPNAIHYPVSELAARYGASVEAETDSGAEAYAGTRLEPGRPAAWNELPWSR